MPPMILEHIDSPADLKDLSPDGAGHAVGRNPRVHRRRGDGHRGPSRLQPGVVELTLALHRTFDSPNDVLLWDTGHQAYVHKLVTGRRSAFTQLRQADGLSGLSRTAPSPSTTGSRTAMPRPS